MDELLANLRYQSLPDQNGRHLPGHKLAGQAAEEIDTLRKERDALRARVEVLEGALRFAANMNTSDEHSPDEPDDAEMALDMVITRARAALEGKE